MNDARVTEVWVVEWDADESTMVEGVFTSLEAAMNSHPGAAWRPDQWGQTYYGTYYRITRHALSYQ